MTGERIGELIGAAETCERNAHLTNSAGSYPGVDNRLARPREPISSSGPGEVKFARAACSAPLCSHKHP